MAFLQTQLPVIPTVLLPIPLPLDHILTVLYQSLSALGPDMYTTLPSILTSPLKTLRRHRLARLRAEGGNIDTSLQSSSRQYSQVHVCSPHFEIFEALTIDRRH